MTMLGLLLFVLSHQVTLSLNIYIYISISEQLFKYYGTGRTLEPGTLNLTMPYSDISADSKKQILAQLTLVTT